MNRRQRRAAARTKTRPRPQRPDPREVVASMKDNTMYHFHLGGGQYLTATGGWWKQFQADLDAQQSKNKTP